MSSHQQQFSSQPLHASVPVVEDSSIARVFAIRTHVDLEYVRAITRPRALEPMGEYLVGRGVITVADLREALAVQRETVGRRLGWILQRLGHLDELSLGRLLAAHLGVPCVTLANYQASGDYRQRMPKASANDDGIAVIHEDALNAWIAVADVTNTGAFQNAASVLGKLVFQVMAGRDDIRRYIRGEAFEETDSPER